MVAMKEALFEWDEWKTQAVAMGVTEDLAELGKTLMRDSYMQRWPEKVLSDCGWNDDGFGMLALARAKPQQARQAWERLYNQHHRRPTCSIELSTSSSGKALVHSAPQRHPEAHFAAANSERHPE